MVSIADYRPSMILLEESRIMLSKSNRPLEPDELCGECQILPARKPFPSIVWSTHSRGRNPGNGRKRDAILDWRKRRPFPDLGMHCAQPSTVASSCRGHVEGDVTLTSA